MSFVSRHRTTFLGAAIFLLLVAIILNKNENEDTNIFARNDDKEFLKIIEETYEDGDLVRWHAAVASTGLEDDPGYLGAAVTVPPERQQEAKDRFKEHAFNVVASELMPLNRTLKDLRSSECLLKEYPARLAPVSVIIVFHNEAWSTLIRTIWSVVSRSPRKLVKEIILVDDLSDMEHLGQKLEEYLPQFPVKVKLLRMPERKGLIRARLLGVKYATAKILVFLDAHCECFPGWLEPLVAAVVERRTTVAAPIIDIIKYQDMSIEEVSTTRRAIFDLGLSLTFYPLSKEERERIGSDRSANIRSPAMAGGLFAMDKEYFHELGEYDPKMVIWGGENIEISLRIWMCGGEIVNVPCSHVGHIFRDQTPYEIIGGVDNVIYGNQARAVDVWMDDHKHIYYSFNPEAIRRRRDVSDRLALRERLQSKSFQWYLDNVFPESSHNVKFRTISQIESLGLRDKCLDTMGRRVIGQKLNVTKCLPWGGNQAMMFTERNEIRPRKYCLDATMEFEPITIRYCHLKGANQYWKYDERSKTIVHQLDEINCLTAVEPDQVTLIPCDGRSTQKWKLNSLDFER